MDDLVKTIPSASVLAKHPLWFLCATPLVTLYLLNYVISECSTKLGLVTASTLITNTYVWNIITSSFYEKYILKLSSDLFSLALVCNNLEADAINIEQISLYLVLTTIACGVVTSLHCFFYLLLTGKEDMLITPLYGFNGVLMALCMYSRSVYKSKVLIEKVPYFSYNNTPIFFLMYMFCCWILGYTSFCKDFLFVIVAWLFCWSYLRFYYKFGTGSSQYGDDSEEFSFVNMFPKSLHIILIPFTTTFYNVFALLGLFPALEETEKKLPHHLRNASTKTEKMSPAPVVKQDLVSDRRRTKALQLLDAKMAEMAKDEDDGWDINLPDTNKMDNEKLKV